MKSVSKFKLNDVSLREEYRRRHDNLWPEMLDLLKRSGIKNYSIWNTEDELIEYLEADDIENVWLIIRSSAVKAQWDNYMDDIIEKDGADGEAVPLTCMYTFKNEE